MKNAMKKLMSLVLVAMILVSAVPFAASAESADAVTVVIVDNATNTDVARFDKVPSNGTATVGNLLKYWVKSTADVESAAFLNAYAYYADGTRADVVEGDGLAGGDKVRIRANITWAQPEQEPEQTPEQEPEQTPEQEPVAPAVAPIKVVIKVGSSDNVIWSGEKTPANGEFALVKNLISYCWNSDWENVYEFDYAWSSAQQAKVGQETQIYAGDTLSIMLKEKDAAEDTTPSTPNGTGSSESGYHKLSGTVTLRILMKGTNTYKDIAIKTGIAADGKVTLAEVKSVVNYYYNSIDTDTGILVDGIYIDDSVMDLWMSYAHDEKYDTILGLYDAAYNNNDVRLTVVIDNAKLASTSSSNADTTNPKTGDSIMMPVAIMTVTASMLAVAFFFNKKRAI